MDHSAGSYMYDPQGRLRLFNRYGSGAPALAADVQAAAQGQLKADRRRAAVFAGQQNGPHRQG